MIRPLFYALYALEFLGFVSGFTWAFHSLFIWWLQ